MIDFRQIRAARALLNWSQADLARAAGMATSSIKNIESEASTARKETLEHISGTFDLNGIEFLAHSGVRLKTHIVTVHDGVRATSALLDDIYAHVQTTADREVCIIGIDEAFSIETDGGLLLTAHIERLAKAGATERILICEGDTRYLNKPEFYRWIPRKYFTRTAPIYVYGDRIAIHSGTLKRRTIVIEARPLAHHMRMLFGLLWDCVGIVPPVAAAPPRLRAVG